MEGFFDGAILPRAKLSCVLSVNWSDSEVWAQRIVWDTHCSSDFFFFWSCKCAALTLHSSKKMFLLSLVMSYVDKW